MTMQSKIILCVSTEHKMHNSHVHIVTWRSDTIWAPPLTEVQQLLQNWWCNWMWSFTAPYCNSCLCCSHYNMLHWCSSASAYRPHPLMIFRFINKVVRLKCAILHGTALTPSIFVLITSSNSYGLATHCFSAIVFPAFPPVSTSTGSVWPHSSSTISKIGVWDKCD